MTMELTSFQLAAFNLRNFSILKIISVITLNTCVSDLSGAFKEWDYSMELRYPQKSLNFAKFDKKVSYQGFSSVCELKQMQLQERFWRILRRECAIFRFWSSPIWAGIPPQRQPSNWYTLWKLLILLHENKMIQLRKTSNSSRN